MIGTNYSSHNPEICPTGRNLKSPADVGKTVCMIYDWLDGTVPSVLHKDHVIHISDDIPKPNSFSSEDEYDTFISSSMIDNAGNVMLAARQGFDTARVPVPAKYAVSTDASSIRVWKLIVSYMFGIIVVPTNVVRNSEY